MLENKVIKKSRSPWASPLVLVQKKDGSHRFCVDFRKLNEATVKDNYPLPLINETLDQLEGARYFTTLDLASGYWQIALDEESKEKTAFISKKGLYQFEVMPFGLSNAGATFQRTMEYVLKGLTNVLCYLDDILVYSKTFKDHMDKLEKTFMSLEKANLKLKPSKCIFCSERVEYLGFIVTKEGIVPNPAKTSAIKSYPVPRTAKEVKRFMGIASYYRRFIKNFSTISNCINCLLKKRTRIQMDRRMSRKLRKS